MLDWFRKDKKENPINIPESIVEVQLDDVVDYEMKSWKVEEDASYDWGNNEFSKEFKLNAGDEKLFLHIGEDDELELSVSRKAKWSVLQGNIRNQVLEYGEPPNVLVMDGITYNLSDSGGAKYRSISRGSGWEHFSFWEYEDADEELLICIEYWDGDWELSIGKYVESFEFSLFRPNN
jgi:hypothetical protein